MPPIEAGIHGEVVNVDGSGAAGGDEEIRDLNGGSARVAEGNL